MRGARGRWGGAYHRLDELQEANRRVDHTLIVREEATLLLSLLQDAETGARGYLLTGADAYLEPYAAAMASLPDHLERLGRLTADNPRQQANLRALDSLIQQKLAGLQARIRARQALAFDTGSRSILTAEGKQVMDEIRRVIAAMRAEEDRLLSERVALEERRARTATATAIGGILLALVLLAVATLLLGKTISERERERALRTTAEAVRAAVAAAEAQLNITLRSIGDAVIATDAAGRVSLMNGVAETLTGWREAEARGRPLETIFRIVNEHTRRPVENPVIKVQREGTIAGLANHTILVARDGRDIPIDDSAAPIEAPDGSVAGVVMVFRDITERRQADAERALLLEREQAARTEAQNASRAKDDFLAILSHDLRTPLNAMLGWVTMLRAGMLDTGTSKRALEVIERNLHYQQRLISDLLDVNRIGSGKLVLEMRTVSLPSLIDEVVISVRPGAETKGVRVSAVLDHEVGPIRGDPERLQQVVWNLLTNAVKFTPPGGRVEVRLGRTENGSRLGVIDTGQGISAELLPHVFERFRQGPGPQTREGEGLGLGLAIAREIVQRHGGTISVSSPGRGRGATFTVDLPARTPGPLESGQAPAARPAPQARGALRGIRVLVVDDDADTTELIAMVVAEHGAEAAAVVSVTDARLALAKSPPQVLICDLAMPGEDGLGFIREVRAASHERARDIFAIAVSGYARPEDRARALSAGFNAYLAKPLDPMVLVELVSRGSRGEPWAETDASPGPERDTG